MALLALPFIVLELSRSEKKIELASKRISQIAVSFGIGVGLVALGFTSPAAIGVLASIIAPIICVSLSVLMNKAVECFSSKKSIQPDGFLIGEVHVDEGSRILQP